MPRVIKNKVDYAKVGQHMLDCIDLSGYEIDLAHKRIDRLLQVQEIFHKEYDWNIKRIGEQRAFTEWLSGLPSCFTIAFANVDILKLAVKWGSLPKDATEAQEDKILDNYWNFMSMAFFGFVNKHRKL